jgi:O-methyltransferase
MSRVSRAARRLLLRRRPQLVYPTPLSSLQPERLYAYLDVLFRAQAVQGDVVEVGCWVGGTAAIASRMLRRLGSSKRYVCVDTFSGFVPSQFEHDLELGVPQPDASLFKDSSVGMVRTLLDHYGCGDVQLVQGDIVTLDDHALPADVSVALVDVDLELPVAAALHKLWPRLSPGGTMLVDDCPEETSWRGAKQGYLSFLADVGLSEEYRFGLGVVRSQG